MDQVKRAKKKMSLGSDQNALTWLIVINATVFVIINFVKIVLFLTGNDVNAADISFQQGFLHYISVPSQLTAFVSQPWSILTYMFGHESMLFIFSSLLWLWAFGYILQDLVGNDKLFPLYIYGGIVGAIIFMLTGSFIPAFAASGNQYMLGGSASIMCIAIATTTIVPNYRILPMLNGGIPLWVVAIIFIIVDFAGIASSQGSFALAHIGGAAMGYIFATQLKKGNNMGAWMGNALNWLNDLWNPDKQKNTISSNENNGKKDLFYKSDKKPFSKEPLDAQQRVDELLDKINNEGYDHLTEDEKAFLKEFSKK